MRRHSSFIVHGVAAAIVWTGCVQSAGAAGLIPTERVRDQAVPEQTVPEQTASRMALDAAHAQRSRLADELMRAGVEPRHAEARLAALSDAEVAELSARYAAAPAGGMWFTPFLLVAMVIGALIRKNERPGATAESDTDLFGRPRSIAAAP